ncbi:hypothetical protein LTS10_011071 [Elasticomyces elasticus]|nr:hypothetical protein LTS10_011071 [Elasticomyces elasticus]
MRLLNTSTFTLEYYEDDNLVPEYAIFSHKWYASGEELILLDFQTSGNAPHKKGFTKVQGLCAIAAAKGHRFVWVDSCCIDKTNDAELSKSINSMFRWYQNAAECIAFLGDVGGNEGRSMDGSIWFKRGWTLQELIAPRNMTFYDQYWNCLGTKKDLLEPLWKITGIPLDVLTHDTHFSSCSIAQRMSWASDRETRDVEDQAYSLMGLFDISLKLIYGEGEKAFIKLQREIIANSADQSIFCWREPDSRTRKFGSSLLAPSPRAFAEMNGIVPTSVQSPYSLTNIGLSIQLYTWPYSMETCLAYLDCRDVRVPDSQIAILIAKLPTENQYVRVADQKTIEPPRPEGSEIRILSRAVTTAKDRVMLAPGMVGDAGIISIDPRGKGQSEWSLVRWIKLQFDDEFRPMVVILNVQGRSDLRGKLNQRTFDRAFNSRQQTGSSADQELFNDFSWFESKQSQSSHFSPKPDRSNKWDKGFYSMTFVEKPGALLCDLEDLNLSFWLKLLPDPSSDDGLSGNILSTDKAKYIWTVYITELSADLSKRSPWSSLRSLITGKK